MIFFLLAQMSSFCFSEANSKINPILFKKLSPDAVCGLVSQSEVACVLSLRPCPSFPLLVNCTHTDLQWWHKTHDTHMTMKQLKVLTAIKEDQIKYCKCFEKKRQFLQSGSTGQEKMGKVDFQVEAHEQSHMRKHT